jgi:hypothetical protein
MTTVGLEGRGGLQWVRGVVEDTRGIKARLVRGRGEWRTTCTLG